MTPAERWAMLYRQLEALVINGWQVTTVRADAPGAHIQTITIVIEREIATEKAG
jgi:hypothetical protein